MDKEDFPRTSIGWDENIETVINACLRLVM